MLAVGFACMAFIMLRKFPSTSSLVSVFYHKRMLDFVKCFSILIERVMWVFSPFIMLMCYITLVNFNMMNHLCNLGINPILS